MFRDLFNVMFKGMIAHKFERTFECRWIADDFDSAGGITMVRSLIEVGSIASRGSAASVLTNLLHVFIPFHLHACPFACPFTSSTLGILPRVPSHRAIEWLFAPMDPHIRPCVSARSTAGAPEFR